MPETLAVIIAGLCQALAVHCARNHAIAPIGLLLWERLHRNAARLQRLFVRWSEGRLRAPRNLPSNRHATRERTATKPKLSLPRGSAWLVKLVPQAAIYRAQLLHLLTNPEMAAFMADAPQAGRMLLPLCRMLAVQPLPQMLPLPKPKPIRPEKPPRKRQPPGMTAKKALRLWYAEHISPRPRRNLPEDLRYVRPVSFWCRRSPSRA